jgi:hypothetical protein
VPPACYAEVRRAIESNKTAVMIVDVWLFLLFYNILLEILKIMRTFAKKLVGICNHAILWRKLTTLIVKYSK